MLGVLLRNILIASAALSAGASAGRRKKVALKKKCTNWFKIKKIFAPVKKNGCRRLPIPAALIIPDLDFADVRRYPPSEYHGIMIPRLPDDAVVDIADVLERFLAESQFAAQLPARLAIVDEARVRFRPTLEQAVS